MTRSEETHQLDHTSDPNVQAPSEKSPVQPSEDEQHFASGGRLAVIILAILFTMFLVALDRTIIATAVPTIANEFQALNDISWYAGAYLLTSCGTQLSWGKVYTLYSTKVVFLLAIIIFEVGSALCGGAPNSNAFIVGRAIAGIGSAGIFSGATVIIAQIIPLPKRPIYVGLMGCIFGLSSIVGPLMGGAFTDRVTWRWCFYINLPIGGVTLAILILFLSIPSQPKQSCSWSRHFIRMDPIGTVLFLPAVICFLLALQMGGTAYPWNNGRIIALFVLSGVLLISFIAVQIWQQEDATVPPRILWQRSIISGMVFAICVYGGLITMLYSLPLWFQAVKSTTAVQSGIDTIPMVIALVVSAIISGGVITATGYYVPWMFVATILMSTGAGMVTTFKIDTGHSAWIGYQVLFGLGMGSGLQQPSLAAQTVLGDDSIAIGVSLMFFAQNLGGTVFISVGQSLFTNYLASQLTKVPGINAAQLLSAGSLQISKLVPADKLSTVLIIYNDALWRSFVVVVALTCLMIVPSLTMEWRTTKKDNISVPAQ
ncbi:Major Facilitator Superfamily [Aspergillus sclerotialis]|uniref:Major Facilitator Superfamily n=1 Tax=Aspergillus sclerotialis TaxID=2070753 RepID=A0A3A2ZLL4_9EURO|nr:Major Facilitator Superfamily [Aspergillus sclerotialis]